MLRISKSSKKCNSVLQNNRIVYLSCLGCHNTTIKKNGVNPFTFLPYPFYTRIVSQTIATKFYKPNMQKKRLKKCTFADDLQDKHKKTTVYYGTSRTLSSQI